MLFKVSGKFASGHTFSVNPIDGDDAKDALGKVINSDEVKNYPSPVTSVMVKALSGKNKKIRISDEPAAERKPSKKKTAPAPATPAPRKR